MRLNLPTDDELQLLGSDSPYSPTPSDRNIRYMAREILEYHKLVDMLKQALGITLIESILKIGSQYNDE